MRKTFWALSCAVALAWPALSNAATADVSNPASASASSLAATSGAASNNARPVAANADALQIQRGAYLAVAGDCIACHTAGAGKGSSANKPFAGGLPMAIPMLGTIYTSNITPDRASGIGDWSLADFDRALRRGVSKDGHNLYPAMPYVSYSKMNDADVAALYAYFEKGVPAVSHTLPKSTIPWPMNMRWPLKFWNMVFLPEGVYQFKPGQSEAWNRGAYLVQGLAHCSTCHTPRGIGMQEVALDETGKGFLGGSILAGWDAYNITSSRNSGIGTWSQAQLAQYLRTGNVPHLAQAAGPMGEAVEHSFSHLSAQDVDAIATYIRTIPAVDDGSAAPRTTLGRNATDVDALRGVALTGAGSAAVNTSASGPMSTPASASLDPARLYLGNCATCHQATGAGSPDGYYPSLMRNSTVGAADAGNIAQVILRGVHRNASGNDVAMPGFATELSDEQIAALTDYLTTQFGNPKATLSAKTVAKLRQAE